MSLTPLRNNSSFTWIFKQLSQQQSSEVSCNWSGFDFFESWMIHVTDLYVSHSQFINGNFTLVFMNCDQYSSNQNTHLFYFNTSIFFCILNSFPEWLDQEQRGPPLWMFVMIVWGERISEIRKWSCRKSRWIRSVFVCVCVCLYTCLVVVVESTNLTRSPTDLPSCLCFSFYA